MTIISQVATAMQTVLTTVSDTAAKACGLIKRRRKLTGAGFVQTVVFGWLANPEATLDELSQTAATVGIDITPQAIDQRFTQPASETLKMVLDATVEQVIAQNPQAVPILQRFNGVLIDDSSWIVLPDPLAEVWQGCGGQSEKNTQSGLKIHLRWDILTGALEHLVCTDATVHDQTVTNQAKTLPTGSLRLADLGYFSLSELKAHNEEQVFWLTRIKANCAVFDTSGNRRDLATWLSESDNSAFELSVRLGVRLQLPARLFTEKVDEPEANKRRRQFRKQAKRKGKTPSKARLKLAAYNIWITNVPKEKLSQSEAMSLARVRWQIELLFKLWKSQGQIDSSRSQKPWRRMCEVYAKLIAMIIQHWLLLCGGCHALNRSFVKASKTVAKHAFHLASAFA